MFDADASFKEPKAKEREKNGAQKKRKIERQKEKKRKVTDNERDKNNERGEFQEFKGKR